MSPDYETASLDATRTALLDLARGLTSFERTFGTRAEVDPVRHLIGTAAGWGGLPTSEAAYVGVQPNVPAGDYELVLRDVPVDAFWSISVYDAQGFFAPNARNRYSVNSVTAVPDADGAVTVRFSPSPAPDAVNSIVTPEGWNFVLRFYRPRPAFDDGSWVLPELTPAG